MLKNLFIKSEKIKKLMEDSRNEFSKNNFKLYLNQPNILVLVNDYVDFSDPKILNLFKYKIDTKDYEFEYNGTVNKLEKDIKRNIPNIGNDNLKNIFISCENFEIKKNLEHLFDLLGCIIYETN